MRIILLNLLLAIFALYGCAPPSAENNSENAGPATTSVASEEPLDKPASTKANPKLKAPVNEKTANQPSDIDALTQPDLFDDEQEVPEEELSAIKEDWTEKETEPELELQDISLLGPLSTSAFATSDRPKPNPNSVDEILAYYGGELSRDEKRNVVSLSLRPIYRSMWHESCEYSFVMGDRFGGPAFGDDELMAFETTPRITEMFLPDTEISNSGLAKIATTWPKLKKLGLKSSQVTDVGCVHLSRLPDLEQLSLEDTDITDTGIAHLRDLGNLKFLNFIRTKVSDAGLRHLTGQREIELLWLHKTDVTGAGLRHVLRGRKLWSLMLGHTKINDEHLAEIGAQTDLLELGLSHTGISDTGIGHLTGLKKLNRLHLDGTQITDAGLAHLKALPQLLLLDLDTTNITDAGLAQLTTLPRLIALDLHGTNVTDAAVDHLILITTLEQLAVSKTRITDAAVERLRAALPDCTVMAKDPIRALNE